MTEIYPARSSRIAARLLGGEMMIMSVADSTFFTLNEVGTAIWQAADGRTPLSAIVRREICQKFEVDLPQAESDASIFVTELSRHGILVIHDRPSALSSENP